MKKDFVFSESEPRGSFPDSSTPRFVGDLLFNPPPLFLQSTEPQSGCRLVFRSNLKTPYRGDHAHTGRTPRGKSESSYKIMLFPLCVQYNGCHKGKSVNHQEHEQKKKSPGAGHPCPAPWERPGRTGRSPRISVLQVNGMGKELNRTKRTR